MDDRATSTLTLLVAAAIIIALLGALWFIQRNTASIHTPDVAVKNEPYRVIPKHVKQESEQYRYLIEVTYPEIVGVPRDVAERINAAIAIKMEERIATFARQSKESYISLPEQLRESLRDTTGTLTSSYYIPEFTEGGRLFTVVFELSYFSLGAAHPGHLVEVMHFDTANGAELRFADFFENELASLEFLSSYSRMRLTEMLGDAAIPEFIEEGTIPTSSSFDVMYFTETGMRVIFNEYQVAPYAAGMQEVDVSYELLRPYLDHESVLVQVLNEKSPNAWSG